MIRASSATLLAALFLACGTSTNAPSKCAASQNLCLPPAGAASFCADLTSDPKNCGACNLACPPVTGSAAVACHTGACVADCGGGFSSTTKVVCGGKVTADGGITAYCTDTTTDHENCGSCGSVCNGAQQCQTGKCTTVTGTAACGGSGIGTTYADLRTDRANCGACGTACATSEICSASACNPCPVAQCGNVCVDTQHDPNNCGACGTVVANCENGVALTKLSIERTGVPFSPAVVGAPGNYTVSVKVHSQARVVRVTATIAASATPTVTTQTDLFLNSAAEAEPTVWTGNLTIPASTPTVIITFAAVDEFYVQRAADAGIVDNIHRDEQVTTATVLAAPGAAAMPTLPVVSTVGTPSFRVGQGANQFAWVPLNGPALQFSVAVPASQNIAAVDFREFTQNSGTTSFGTATVSAGGTAVLSALPAQVGTGDLIVTACPIDSAGQVGPCSASINFTVGRIAPLSGPAVIGKNADTTGNHSIYYIASTKELFAQGASDLNATVSDQPGAKVGAATYFVDTLRPVPEGSGVYAVNSSGTGVDRVDSPLLLKVNYVTPPAGIIFRGIDVVTPAAMLLCDTVAGLPAANAVSYFATASPAQTTVPAVVAGIFQSSGNANRGGLGCPATGSFNSFGNNSGLQTTSSGAIAGWFNNAGDVRPLLFHPAIAAGSHLAPLLAAARPATTARDLKVFPGGEIVFQYTDTTGTAFIGAAYFDGTAQPVLLAPVQIGLTGGGVIGGNFVVASPGVVLGTVPGATAGSGQQIIEIRLQGGTPQSFFPAPTNGTTAGAVQLGGVLARTGFNTSFAISDDQTKALFVTSDQLPGAPNTVYRGHLLDLATGTDTLLGAVPSANFFGYAPHFVHSAQVYAGGAPAGAHQYVVWTETLPMSPGQTISHERISFANFQGTISTVDRLNSYFGQIQSSITVNARTESAAAGALFFLSQTDQGGADLYSVPLTAAAGLVSATRVMDHVFWFKTREDKQRLLVARSDGTLYVAPLVPGANFARTLVPLVNAGFLGDAPILNGNGINSFGFTPDGDHAYVLRDANTSTSSFSGAATTTGIVETIDLTTGAFSRTDFGRVVAGNLGGTTKPIIGFVGGANTAIVLDQLSVEGNSVRLAVAPPGASTSRVDTQALPSGYQPSNDTAVFFSSVDNNEGLLAYQANSLAFGSVLPLLGNGGSVRLQKDGTFDVLFSGSNSGLSQPATVSLFGGPFLPDWSIFNDFDTTSNSLFKVWGGQSPAKFINVSRNFSAQTTALGTVITPDLKELLFSFNDGSAADGYVMALPLPGHTPPAPLNP